ncbi:MAG: hypothetical protein NC517_04580 [Firmicutes bacterium]|nr:hypothetical protein [Bacillota bacterium]
MQVEVNEQFKFASVWLTKEEKDNSDVFASLQPLIDKYKAMKYRFVIFQSGTQNLLELTQGLLSHNKNLCRNSIGEKPDAQPEKKTSLKKKLATLGQQAGNRTEKASEEKVRKAEEVL